MYTKTVLVAALAGLFASAAASAMPAEQGQGLAARSALIATSPCKTPLSSSFILLFMANLADYACNCPNNCSYKKGHSCKYFKGPSDNSPIVSGSESSRFIHSYTAANKSQRVRTP